MNVQRKEEKLGIFGLGKTNKEEGINNKRFKRVFKVLDKVGMFIKSFCMCGRRYFPCSASNH